MADATRTQVKARLNVRLADTANTTYSSAEKDEFLAKAYADSYNYGILRDSSLTSGEQSYSMPGGMVDIFELWIDVDGTDTFKTAIPRESYDVINGTLYLRDTLPSGKSILMVGLAKYTTTDLIPDLNQDYVLELAIIEAKRFLKNRFSTRFLKNDVRMSDLLQDIQDSQQEVGRLRSQLMNQRLVVL